MASFYSSEGDMLPPSYLLDQKVDSSYPVSQPCVSLSFPNLLSESTVTRDEAIYIPATGLNHLNVSPRYSDGNTVLSEAIHANNSQQIPQYHHHHYGLSLSLGSQESSLLDYTDSSLSSLLSPNNMQNFIPGPNQDFTFCTSKYLKAAQDLLDELVSVHRVGQERVNAVGQDGSGGADLKRDGVSGELQESNNNDLSPSERHDLQNKLTKLLSMLEEVDKRYKQYCHQIQVVASSFDSVAGGGAALPYTALARRTISRQFRSLRDAIKKQIQATQKSLGDQDVNSHGLGILSRLRFVDQQLRQQKALQQFGVMRQPWRPQRGLPETAVSVLRAWLFEHFLHPYPKDSEKIVLARQTGLTRSQVANWFINARVRLWKPMIEEMYKEEFGDPETEPKPSPTTHEVSAFDERDEEFHGTLISAAAEDDNHRMQSNESTYTNKYFQGNEVNFGLSHIQNRDAVDIGVVEKNQVSLALGLHHTENESKPITDHGIQRTGNDAASSSSVVHEKLDYYYVETVNNHESNFSNSNLLSDFVA